MSNPKVLTQLTISLALCAAAAAQTPTFTKLAQMAHHPHPYGGLVQGLNGQLYSTTAGANRNFGQVFQISTHGDLKTLDILHGMSENGLVLATDGNFYGNSLKGGRTRAGTLFRVTPQGKLIILHSFCLQTGCPDGAFPDGPLIQGADGEIYGTTTSGGPGCTAEDYACGTVFKMTLEGVVTTLYTFCLQAGCPDGRGPAGALVQTAGGDLYGTSGGGTAGQIYKLTRAGKLTPLYRFCMQPGCPDGADPQGGLSLGPDGALYGATVSYATVYRITPEGAFQVLDQLSGYGYAPPIAATDGNLYGVTGIGGAYDHGSIYSLTTSGTLTTLYSFCPVVGCKDGTDPVGPLFQATDGNFYGTTYGMKGGTGGTVYKLSTGLAPFVSPVPTHGPAGKQVSILGNNLTGATAVSFNGTPAASFTVNATGSAITATVPEGATTGSIQVTLADATVLSSNVPFQVTQ